MNLKDCHNFKDFRKLAKKKLPSPIFHYIDGAADDEVTYARNTSAFDDVDLVPNVLRGVENVDLSTTIFGKKLDLPFYLAPTALQICTAILPIPPEAPQTRTFIPGFNACGGCPNNILYAVAKVSV